MPKAAHDHSDNEKFCNDLKGSKSCKMSEWPLKVFQDFLTSNLNTSFDAYLTLRLIVIVGRMVGQAGTLAVGEDWGHLGYPWALTSRG